MPRNMSLLRYPSGVIPVRRAVKPWSGEGRRKLLCEAMDSSQRFVMKDAFQRLEITPVIEITKAGRNALR